MQTSQTLDLRPSEIDLRMVAGTDASLLFTLTDKNGAAVDITADTVIMTARKDIAGDVVFSLTNTMHTVPAQGQTTFILPRATIAAAALVKGVTTWVYEVRRFIGGLSGDEAVHVQGELLVEAAVGTP